MAQALRGSCDGPCLRCCLKTSYDQDLYPYCPHPRASCSSDHPGSQPTIPPPPGAPQIYAYTSSRIQMRVLEEFCRLDCALPNLFVGTLTRDSVQRALGKGMTADDIIGFLQSHAHPQVAARIPSVPEVRQRGGGGAHLHFQMSACAHPTSPCTLASCSASSAAAVSLPKWRKPRVPPLSPSQPAPLALPSPADGAGPDPAVGARDQARGGGGRLLVLKL